MARVGTPLPQPQVNERTRELVPFRRATVERVDTLPAEALTVTAGAQRIERNVEGSGFIYGILLDVVATATGNAAAVTFAEDAPWSALDSIVFRDVNGELINLTGFDLFIANLMQKNYANRYLDQSALTNLGTTGAGATGGSFSFMLDVPIAINRRDLIGIVGNQDRAEKWALRSDLAASASIYGTAPTALPPVTINKFYENYSVPNPTSPSGAAQEVLPPSFGTLHFLTSTQADAVPAPSTTVNHFLRRIGNTIRAVALVFRAGAGTTPRATADANLPTNIRMKVGEDTLFNETARYRKAQMFKRYGFDFPAGVLVYDAMHDFDREAGAEVGDDYYHTQALVNAQFIISYPSGYTAGGSLRFITDDLIYTPPFGG